MRLRLFSLFLGVVLMTGGAASAARPTALPTVLVLYDTAGPYGYIGEAYAIMLRNLLGHFNVTPVALPVAQYDTVRNDARVQTFYLGSTYEEASYYAPGSAGALSYAHFSQDVATGMPAVWIGYNLWHLAWGWDPAWGSSFPATFGFTFDGLTDRQFNRVEYKGVVLDKAVLRHLNPGGDTTGCSTEPATGFYDCSPWAAQTTIVDATRATAAAATTSTVSGARTPYVMRGGSLWFVADMPFSYISEEDRYLVIADLLHDMLGMPGVASKRALVRFEDVNATDDPAAIQAASSVASGLGMPISIATIPVYVDPTGFYNGGTPQRVPISGSAVGRLLANMQGAGASIVQHGTTHQWDGGSNPFNGVTGDDFEFYRVTEQPDHALTFVGPVPGDSTRWAKDRINAGKSELKRAGLTAFAWEPPHYLASETDRRAIDAIYPVYYGRAAYFPSSGPAGRIVGQFFPYVVRDIYGETVIPENLGDISPTEWNGYPASLPEDLLRHARALSVVRDGIASFFFHPYLDPSFLDQTLRGLRSLGYTFIRACSLVDSCARITTKPGSSKTRVKFSRVSTAKQLDPMIGVIQNDANN